MALFIGNNTKFSFLCKIKYSAVLIDFLSFPVLYHTCDSLYISKRSSFFLIGILSSNEVESWFGGCISMCRIQRLKLSKKMPVEGSLKTEMCYFYKLMPSDT